MIFRKKKIFQHQGPILVNSIPKSGTNLLLNVIKSIPNTRRGGDFSYSQRYTGEERMNYVLSNISTLENGVFYSGHLPFSVEMNAWLSKNGFKQVFIYRDPIDVVLSAYYFILEMKNDDHPHYKVLMELGEHQDKLIDLIAGIGDGKNDLVMSNSSQAAIRFMFEHYQNWLTHPDVLSIKFEDFIQDETREMIRILEFFGFTDKEEMKLTSTMVSNGMNPQKSHTFRKGKSGGWKDEFNEERMKFFDQYFPTELLNKYGYQK
jgi:hypothetical protein